MHIQIYFRPYVCFLINIFSCTHTRILLFQVEDFSNETDMIKNYFLPNSYKKKIKLPDSNNKKKKEKVLQEFF